MIDAATLRQRLIAKGWIRPGVWDREMTYLPWLDRPTLLMFPADKAKAAREAAEPRKAQRRKSRMSPHEYLAMREREAQELHMHERIRK